MVERFPDGIGRSSLFLPEFRQAGLARAQNSIRAARDLTSNRQAVTCSAMASFDDYASQLFILVRTFPFFTGTPP